MIYLIKAYGEDGPLLKIGYTSNLKSRMNSYKTSTPDFKLLDTREGNLDLEAGLHKYFKDYRYSFEWFRYDKFIVDNFKTVNPPIELTIPEKVSTRRRNLVLRGAISDLKIENKNHKTLSGLLSRLLKTISLRTDEDIEPVKKCLKEEYLDLTEPVLEFLEEFYKIAITRERLKYVCTANNNFTEEEWEQVFSEIPDFYRNFYLGLGPERCRSLGYNFTLLQKDYDVKFFNSDMVRNSILSVFSVGDKLSKAEIKQKLANLYSSLNYKKSPKASDLEDFFELKSCKVKDSSGNWVNGFELLSQKNTVPPKSL